MPTGVEQTLLLTGDIERLMATELPSVVAGADDVIRVIGLGLSGRLDEARDRLVAVRQASRIPTFQSWTEYLMIWLDRKREDMLSGINVYTGLKIRDDPEAMFQHGWMLCDVGAHDAGLEFLQQAVTKGYFAATTLANSRQFDALRSRPAFQALQAEADAGRRAALAAFRAANGERLVGV